ncbi:7867_t:CDS:2, partial [Ambispora leptoticha]
VGSCNAEDAVVAERYRCDEVANENIEVLKQSYSQNNNETQQPKQQIRLSSPVQFNNNNTQTNSHDAHQPPSSNLIRRESISITQQQPPLLSSQTSSNQVSLLNNNDSEQLRHETTSSNQGPSSPMESRFPAALSDLVASFEAAKEKSLNKDDGFHVQQMLDASLEFVPESLDAERPKYYAPRNPYLTSQYYPQAP